MAHPKANLLYRKLHRSYIPPLTRWLRRCRRRVLRRCRVPTSEVSRSLPTTLTAEHKLNILALKAKTQDSAYPVRLTDRNSQAGTPIPIIQPTLEGSWPCSQVALLILEPSPW